MVNFDTSVLSDMVVFSFLGLSLGCIVDVTFIIAQSKFTGKYKKTYVNLVFFMLQMLISILVLWSVHLNLTSHKRTSLPAMIFSTTYFGIQSNLFSNIQILYRELFTSQFTQDAVSSSS